MGASYILPFVIIFTICPQSRELSGFFSFRELDRRSVGIVLERSLQDLVDQSAPTSSIHFRLACRGISGVSISLIHWIWIFDGSIPHLFQETDYLPVTVFVEDVNDNQPIFVGAPYRIRIDELTPPGKY